MRSRYRQKSTCLHDLSFESESVLFQLIIPITEQTYIDHTAVKMSQLVFRAAEGTQRWYFGTD